MTPGLLDLIISRLDRSQLGRDVDSLILAACEGEAELAAYLEDPIIRTMPEDNDRAEAAVPGVFLGKLSVQGFRGIGRESVLEIPEGPGLTLIMGRNGSGKS